MADDSPTGLRWWIGGFLVVSAFLWTAREHQIDLYNSTKAHLVSLTDSVQQLQDAQTALRAEERRVDSASRVRLRTAAVSTQVDSASFDDLREAAQADSVRLHSYVSLAATPMQRAAEQMHESALSAESRYWQGCEHHCNAADRSAMDARVAASEIAHTDYEEHFTRTVAELVQRRRDLSDDEGEARRIASIALYLLCASVSVAVLLSLLAAFRELGLVREYLHRAETLVEERSAWHAFRHWITRRGEQLFLAFTRWIILVDMAGGLAILGLTLPLLAYSLRSFSLLVFWVIAYLVQELLHYHQRRAARAALKDRLAVVQSSFGGNIGTLVQHIRADPQGLTQDAARHLCAGLLQRVRGMAQLLLDAPEDARIRATLALPVIDERTSKVEIHAPLDAIKALRVWCYDEAHGNRRWSRIPIGQPGGPAAFRNRTVEILVDLRNLTVPENLARSEYRSVLSLPVGIGGLNGKPIGVVSIDCTLPNFFGAQSVTTLVPAILPMVNFLSLVLLAVRRGENYVFEQ